MQIDFVIPWVDGADPEWCRERHRHSNDPRDMEECRFRDWEILRYWFRAVEAYAPWVHAVHFVTCGQVPPWLNLHHPTLHFVCHRDYIPESFLPTFSSHTIELNFHRIPGLFEHFVYFNDDMLLNAPVEPEDFFRKGLPCEYAVMGNFCPMELCDPYTHAQCNVIAFVNKHFNKRSVLRKSPHKWYDPRGGKDFLKNVYGSFTKHFSNFDNLHLPSSMMKSTFDRVWEMEPELLDRTCRNKFRQLEDVNQYIMSDYHLCTGQFYPRRANFGKCYGIGRNREQMYRDILTGEHKTICINDNAGDFDFEAEKRGLLSVYERKFPNKSSFEL